jgi:serine/threonine-protein kinase RsbW
VSGTRREFPREIASLDEMFSLVRAFAEEHRLDERTIFSITLVVEELFTNMVRHNVGGSDHVTLELAHDEEHVFLELVDIDVEPFDPATVAAVPVDAGIEERKPGGLGVHLVRKLVDDVTYDYDAEDRRMRISVKKTVEL